ncbi:MAG: MFS transporter, partial [Burkholderia sp.]|nr:MFS transporter [Burkholderia sp.]
MESKTLAAPAAEPASPERNGLFSWYADAQPRERRAFWSCKVGYMLDGMDT